MWARLTIEQCCQQQLIESEQRHTDHHQLYVQYLKEQQQQDTHCVLQDDARSAFWVIILEEKEIHLAEQRQQIRIDLVAYTHHFEKQHTANLRYYGE
jgi:hypothetical protein